MNPLPKTGFLRISQIVGDARKGIPALIPISRAAWWEGVRAGRFPAPIKLGPKTTVWRVEDILAFIENARGGWRS
jgi:predicted DNA-binding transcriptional regulator AlpA